MSVFDATDELISEDEKIRKSELRILKDIEIDEAVFLGSKCYFIKKPWVITETRQKEVPSHKSN